VPISEVLAEVVQRESELQTALDAEHLECTRKAVATATARRENAFLDKLRQLADDYHKR
jgi:hypothetical protein